MDGKTASMLLAGMDEKSIRSEFNEYLMHYRCGGSEDQRSKNTCKFVVANLMKTWVSPEPELLGLRDSALEQLRKYPSESLAIHWAMICAAYPFWYNVSLQVGRLLNLQDQITLHQITNRLKEQYGDRQTISRYARYVIRSLVEWGILKDSECKGCYVKANQLNVHDDEIVVLLVESVLYAIPENKGCFKMITSSPALFPFQLSMISVDYISNKSNRINVITYGLDEIFLQLK